jgi:hypothetical protein
MLETLLIIYLLIALSPVLLPVAVLASIVALPALFLYWIFTAPITAYAAQFSFSGDIVLPLLLTSFLAAILFAVNYTCEKHSLLNKIALWAVTICIPLNLTFLLM